MQFKWNKKSSKACFVAGVVTRIRLQGMSIEKAIEETWSASSKAKHPELIPANELADLINQINQCLAVWREPAGTAELRQVKSGWDKAAYQ